MSDRDASSSGDGGSASRNKAGWADDVVAPRQEVDRLSLVREEVAIQGALKRVRDEDLTPETFLEHYRVARDEYRRRSRAARPSARRVSRKKEKLARFGAQASIQARREDQPRTALICSGPDGTGVLATLSEAIANEGGNIMSAFMSTVGNHLVAAFLIAGANESGIKPDVEQLKRLAERNGTKLNEPRKIRIVSTQMRTDDGEYWARPGARCWHASARYRGEGSLIRELTGVIGRRDLPMIALSSWREADSEQEGEAIQVVDLNLAVTSDDRASEARIVRALEISVQKRLPEVQLEIVPVRWPTRYRSHGNDEASGAPEAVMTVIGHARPGFVHYSIRALETTQGVVKIQGCSMVIIENVSVLTVVFVHTSSTSLKDLREQAKTHLSIELKKSGHGQPTAVQIVRAASARDRGTSERSADRPTHELSIQAVEQPRVVAKVALLMAKAHVNITWFMSAVLNPVVGERWPICVTRMQLHVDGDADALDQRLRDLAETQDWKEASLRPWSLGN